MQIIFLIIIKSLRQHWLSTFVTVLLVGLACGLLMSVFVIQKQAYETMTLGSTQFDAILGARGSSLQLVLNSVFHLDVSPGNIPYKLYETMKADARVKTAIPYAVGDNYKNFRIVATTLDLFQVPFKNTTYQLAQGGRWFDPLKQEAVIGSYVAQTLKLNLGSVFNSYHGVIFEEKNKHPEQFTVVGILKPTNSPSDRVIWIPLDSFFHLDGHQMRNAQGEIFADQGHEPIPNEYKELSAVMIQFKNRALGLAFDQMINRQGKVATLAWPIDKIISDFFNKIGPFYKVLTALAYLIALMGVLSILAAIYNSMNERRREFAILRSLGARRRYIFSAIILESSLIAALGVVLGFILYALVMWGVGHFLRTTTGTVLEIGSFHPIFIIGPFSIILSGALAGLIPAVKAYQISVSENLVPQT